MDYNDNWNYCVSTASSYLSTSWVEHFFETEEEANEFAAAQRKRGKAVLVVDKDEY